MSDKFIQVPVPAATDKIIRERLSPVFDHAMKRLSPRVPLDRQLWALAFDVYIQGLLDGAQVGEHMRTKGELV